MRYYLGIDGGGTNTIFLLVNEKGKISCKSVVGACHCEQIGYQGFSDLISVGLNSVLQQASIAKNQIESIYAAVPGYGESEEIEKKVNQLLAELFSGITWDCGNDVLAGWAGSLALHPGINILAGTGSMAYGRTAGLDQARSGGWGHVCGDEGSAYWLGNRLLKLFAKQADGRLPKSHIYDLLRNRLGLNADFELINIIIGYGNNEREKIASLAPTLYEAAINGDRYALQMFEEAAQELALQAAAVISKINFTKLTAIPVSWSGGVFRAGKIILKPLEVALKKVDIRCKLIKPILSPESGAVLLAKNLNSSISPSFIKKLQTEESRM